MTYFNRALDHINLTVPNMENSITFYTDVMGFKVVEQYNENGMNIVYITDGQVTYELMENTSLKTTQIDHIAYVSSDIELDHQYFIDKGKLTSSIGHMKFQFGNGVDYFFVSASGREKIEFCQKKG